ncbi:D-glycero-beta-D-manno-heptose 1-phosphate adenylyltransferase [Alkalicaulis satelles]|uniref:Bifunctional protein HldE n=2 Tax=Alkalicaulis satelles TaxID=2609175 RepID=A0A5M6ZMH9_9PROT|nr:D-glycero-beta-D-manno-heptose 1-phosphate adenylyltransferase [Alkalicaulis satelles]
MQREHAARLLSAIAGRRALVVGDVILDRFVYGRTERISREAPVPILSETRRSVMLGGAGNLARNIASLGGEAMLVSAAGEDAEGAETGALVREACGEDADLVTEAGRATPAKIRYVAQNQQMFCVDRDPRTPVSDATVDAVFKAAEARLARADVLILSDYGRGLLTPDLIARLVAAARKAGVPVSVDPRGKGYERYDGAAVIKPNADELAAETGLPVSDDAEAETALRALKTRLKQTDALLVTRGGAGMTLLDASGAVTHQRSRPRSVFDVSGAGDTALAALSLAMAAGVPLSEAMALADLAAGVAVGKAGTAVVAPDELIEDALGGAEAPVWRILTRADAAGLTARWRAEGLRVGFTNGCFDILHPGHLSVLRHAASVCDRLVVGLNADASVSRLKGAERPINTAASRALMLASLDMVDRVVVFEEDTPEALIRALNPHVLVKGADYIADELPGAAHVKSRGGEVVLAPLEPGLSTTALVERLKRGRSGDLP